MLFWEQLWSYLAFAREKPLNSLALAAAGPGDSDTVTMFIGIMLGALVGSKKLEEMSVNGVQLDTELAEVYLNCREVFGVDIDEWAEIFSKLIRTYG